MQPITQEDLEQLIPEAKQAGKDVSELERLLETMKSHEGLPSPPAGQRIEKTTARGKVMIESTGPAREEDFELAAKTGGESDLSEETQSAKEENVTQVFPVGAVPGELRGTGFSYRHDWGDLNGEWILKLNWGAVNRESHVFVAIGEGAAGGGKFIGGACYTLHNVAPRAGGVDIRINIDWDDPLRIYVDYFVVNS
jgi:hypothetical protein